jgi:Sulfotransferase family
MRQTRRWAIVLTPVAAIISFVIVRNLRSFPSPTETGVLLAVRNNTETRKKTAKATFYHHEPKVFVDEFFECLADREHCKVLYWHIQKTGGSYIASKMYPYFNEERYRSKEWCCNEKFMKDRFRHNSAEYCSKRLGIYEVQPQHYREVLQTCQDFTEKYNNTSESTARPKHRYIGFVSVREPIQRTLSAIHQACNVHQSHLPNDVKETCQRCSYHVDGDKAFFEKFVNQTNTVYKGLEDLLSSYPTLDIPLYIIDNDQINDLFQQLENTFNHRLEGEGRAPTFRFPDGKKNSEAAAKLCDFGMTSSLMKQHVNALNAYHRIWSM